MAELLPTGTVTLLLADVEGSTQLWDTQPEAMTAAIARMNPTASRLIAEHGGVRPVEQGEGDSFVAAFARAGDAVACALELQRADLAPIKLRIGVHTGDVQLRDEGNYAGHDDQQDSPVTRPGARRPDRHLGRDRGNGRRPTPRRRWLTDLGRHGLRDLPRPMRVSQLCHPDLRNDFPPLRTANAVATHNLPTQLTSFVGRAAQITEISGSLADNRLVTLTGAGGAGKTRLAIEVAAPDGQPVPRRHLLCRSGADHPPRRWCRSRWLARSGCRTNPAARSPRRCCVRSATVSCCWYSTTASTCSRPARSWSTMCLPAAHE